jgi:hypothetical protein
MSRDRAIEQAARKQRLSAIDRCRACDPTGWKLAPDRTPIEPAVRCTHNAPTPSAVRDITEPIHPPELFDTQEPQP